MSLVFPSQFLLSLKYRNPGGAVGRVLGWTGRACDRTPLQVGWGGESLSPSISPSPFSQPHSYPIPSQPSTTCLPLSPPCSLHVLPDFWGSSDPDQGIPVTTCAPCSSCPSWCFQSPISCWEKPELPVTPSALDPLVGNPQDTSAVPRWLYQPPGAGSSCVESNRDRIPCIKVGFINSALG